MRNKFIKHNARIIKKNYKQLLPTKYDIILWLFVFFALQSTLFIEAFVIRHLPAHCPVVVLLCDVFVIRHLPAHCPVVCPPLELHLTTSELWFGQEQEGILP